MATKIKESQFSDLETIKHDPMIQGLEVAGDSSVRRTYQWDDSYQGKEAVFDGPEGIAVNADAERALRQAVVRPQSTAPQQYIFSMSRRTCRVLSTWIVAAAIIVAVGVGVGVGITKRNQSTSVAHDNDLPGFNSTSLAGSNKQGHDMIAGTAFSVVHLTSGDRHLFYQESSGNIMQALYLLSSYSWPTDTSSAVAINARNNTPISTLYYSESSAGLIGDVIYLAYINSTNFVNSKQYVEGQWSSIHVTLDGLPLEASLDSKFLALRKSNLAFNSSLGQQPFPCAIIENRNGNISIYDTPMPSPKKWGLRDVSTALYSSLPVHFGSPFSTYDVPAGKIEDSTAARTNATSLISFIAKNGKSLITSFLNGTIQSGTLSIANDQSNNTQGSLDSSTSINMTALHNSDTLILDAAMVASTFPSPDLTGTLWINGTNLTFFEKPDYDVQGTQLPTTAFPYSRLAAYATTEAQGSFPAYHIYHQLSPTVFVEEYSDPKVGNWVSSPNTTPTT